MSNRLYTIYAVRCKENGRIYVGCTRRRLKDRMRQHLYDLHNSNKTQSFGGNQPIVKTIWQEDYARYGEDSFEYYALEFNVPDENASQRESYWIEEYKSYDERYGYNLRRPCRRKEIDIITTRLPPKPFDEKEDE